MTDNSTLIYKNVKVVKTKSKSSQLRGYPGDDTPGAYSARIANLIMKKKFTKMRWYQMMRVIVMVILWLNMQTKDQNVVRSVEVTVI